MVDLEKLVEERCRIGVNSLGDLGEYYWSFPLRPYLCYRSRLYHIVAHSSYLLAHHIPNSSEGIYRTVDYSSHLFRYRLWCCCVVFDHIATASVSFWSPPRGIVFRTPSGLPLTIPTKFFKLFAPPHGLCDDRAATYHISRHPTLGNNLRSFAHIVIFFLHPFRAPFRSFRHLPQTYLQSFKPIAPSS